MYKVVVADDEEWIRKGIKAILGDMDPAFEIMEAADGEETVECILKTNPDFVMLDVKMPKLDGLEVLARIREQGVLAKVLILSGYSEFDYAQNALNLGACGYLLKPVGGERLKEKVKDILYKIDKSKLTEHLIEEKMSLEQSNVLYKVEKAANILLHSPLKSADPDMQTCSSYLAGEKCRILVFHINNFSFNSWSDEQYAFDNVKTKMKEVLETTCTQLKPAVFDNYKNILEVFVIIKADIGKVLDERVKEYLSAVRGRLTENSGIYTCAAVSKTVEIPDNKTYEMLRTALDIRFINGNDGVFECDELNSFRYKGISEDEIKLLGQLLIKSDYERIKCFLDNMFRRKTDRKDLQNDIRHSFLEIIGLLVRISNQMRMDISNVLTEADLSAEVLDYFDNTVEITNYLYTTIITAFKIDAHEAQKCKNIVEMIVRYVDDNYEKSFSVKDIAYQFAINPNYLSMLFKKSTGQGFVEYVNHRKIDAACNLLLNSSTTSVTEIAESMGFGDIQYFFKLFKKIKGATPLEYKRSFIK